MGRTDNWGEKPLERAKLLIKFLLNYDGKEADNLLVEWHKKDSNRPELKIKTTLKNLAFLLNSHFIKSKYDVKLKKEAQEIQSTIDRLKDLGVIEEQSEPSEKSKGIRRFTFFLWHSNKVQENFKQLELIWGNHPKSAPDKAEYNGISESQSLYLPPKQLESVLEETLKLYIAKCFDDDGFAELDQGGETDPERLTLLRQVFIDLNAKPKEQLPLDLKPEVFSFIEDEDEIPF